MFWPYFRLFACFALCFAFYPHLVFAQPTIDSELLERITRSKNELQEVQQKISAKSRDYSQRLEQKERSIQELRKTAAAQQRLADEQLLSLDKLKERVEQWATQSNYQSHMLNHYSDTIGISQKKETTKHLLELIQERAESALSPAWQQAQVISAEGKLLQTPVLKLGPVEIALDNQNRSGGLLVREAGLEAHIVDVFGSSTQSDLWKLQAEGQGYFPFDPTLGNALQLRSQGEGLMEHLQKGGIWAIPIIFFGFLSLLIALIKTGQFLRLPKVDQSLAERLSDAAHQRHLHPELAANIQPMIASAGSLQRKLAQIAVDNPVSQQRDDLLVAYLMENKHLLEKYMGVVATSAAVAPLLGLLGTVSGMIDTFKMMTIFGSGDASTVSGGISEALITTELGLIVAIPSLIVSALLTRQIKSYTHKLENFAIKLSKVSFSA